MLANKDPDLSTDDEMEECEDDEESHWSSQYSYYQLSPHYPPPPSPSFPSSCYPSLLSFDQPKHQFQPLEHEQYATPGPSNRDANPSPRYMPLLSFSQPGHQFQLPEDECYATPGPSNRDVFLPSCYAPPPSFGQPGHQFQLPEGIHKVFVYNPGCPMEGHRGQLISTGIIKATNETTVSVPLPPSWALPPPFTPPSAAMNLDPTDHMPEASEQPNPPQLLTLMDQKEVMKEAKQVMRQKVLLENAMPDTATNMAMAQATLLEAVKRIVPTVSPNTLTICTIMTTVCTAFKKEEDPNIQSPVNHPAVITTIIRAVWGGILHEALNFDDINTLDNLVTLGGAAVGSSLMEYEEGVHKTVQFAPASRSAALLTRVNQSPLDERFQVLDARKGSK
ncbi:uncharacterized protein BJ212DRAFT_1303149 [Suillus subaureus]|uniref:Uncharacterized protein n=1 Tax=Suillus subaureus TaxID=48587 RepID=A0A9P7E0S7_9AGAM|nr:uncharacterized protein BJ212DRAFT_1303149 [Suillus subaureus]KAG1808281.1 hypothetical protein BJ212DRAFT_1303149 [Suillus subaureus]